MKKQFCACLFAALILLLCACTKQESIDFAAFVDRAAALGCESSVLDYAVSQSEDGCSRMLVLSDRIAVRVFSEPDGKLSQARILFAKLRPNGAFEAMNAQDHRLFMQTAAWMLGAFCGETLARSEARLEELQLNDPASFQKSGELKLQFGSFYAVYQSTQAESVLFVCNRFLLPMPSTQKPESRPAFDSTTAVRTETVPHK